MRSSWLVGMATGVTSLYITWRSTSEEAALRLTAYPTASQADITPQGLGVRVELVNESLRPVVLRSAELHPGREGRRQGERLDRRCRAARAGDLGADAPRCVTADVPHRSGSTRGQERRAHDGRLDSVRRASSDADESAARGSFRQLTATLASLPEDQEQPAKGEARPRSGWNDLYPVTAVNVPASSVDAIETAGALLRRVPPQFWVVDLLARGKELEGITLRRRFAGADEVDLAQLDVWNVRSPFHRTSTRPVVARQQTLFPLDNLAPRQLHRDGPGQRPGRRVQVVRDP